jgi:release factor glutamine methyltransferase
MKDKLLTYLEVIELSTEYLSKRGVENPKCDAEWIVSNITGKKRVEIYLNYENIISLDNLDAIRRDLIKRGKRIPLQHILGKINFAGQEILCDQRALIPRHETEQLTELIETELIESFEGNFLDLGTGSGVILITLCKTFPLSKGLGIDISKKAISLAKENLNLNNIKNARIEHLDWENDILNERFEVIISNPPYLSEEEWEQTEPEVKNYDPKNALVAKDDGLRDIKNILQFCEDHLSKDGLLALEIGHGQDKVICESMHSKFYNIRTINDYCRKPRFIIAKKK